MKHFFKKFPNRRRVISGVLPDVMLIAGQGCLIAAAASLATGTALLAAGILLIVDAIMIAPNGDGGGS
ncbi:MAG: hypothetical protein ACI3XY_04510 [Butyricicoccaceae bacterium]